MNPWADMVRLARSGGEANAISIRIMEAATGREKIAVCGYHGWHDWYLAANLENTNKLDGHLLPGLEPSGVPNSLRGVTIPFNYGDIDTIEKLIKSNELAAVKMEVSSSEPDLLFLSKIRNLTKKHNTVLIFDECTSGFRECYGGLYKKYKINPDMVMYGKTLGNGYAITSVVGKESIMTSAQSTFISSTFWTERIGPTAALKNLKILKDEKPWKFINMQAKEKIRKMWREVDKDLNLGLKIGGIPALSSFTIDHPDWQKYKTYITQEGLRNNFLLGNSIYFCAMHKDNELEQYEKLFRKICLDISKFIDGKDINESLLSSEAHAGFKRLN